MAAGGEMRRWLCSSMQRHRRRVATWCLAVGGGVEYVLCVVIEAGLCVGGDRVCSEVGRRSR